MEDMSPSTPPVKPLWRELMTVRTKYLDIEATRFYKASRSYSPFTIAISVFGWSVTVELFHKNTDPTEE